MSRVSKGYHGARLVSRTVLEQVVYSGSVSRGGPTLLYSEVVVCER